MEVSNLNWEQKKAIDLEVEGKLPELAEHLKELGRHNKDKEIVEEILEDEISKFMSKDKKGEDKLSIDKITNYLLYKYSFKTIYGTKDEKIYFFDEGIYTLRGKEVIKTNVEKLLKSYCNSRIVMEVLEKIKRKTAISQDKFDKVPEELICLDNGILNVKDKTLIGHHPHFYFKSKLNIKFDDTKEINPLKKFIEETFYPEDVPVIQEWLGFNLYKKYFVKKAIILFGEKNTGKTVFLNVLIKFLSQKNCAGISLQRIASKDKFSLSFLKDKLANIYDDLSSDDLKDSGGFKIATGGGYATAEYKFGDSFQFLNYAKNIFSTNMIPNVKDINDDAYYERWIPIPLDNQVDKNNQDPFLYEKLTTEDELSGLLNWALEGLERLLKKGRFSFNKDSSDIKVIMQRQNNPLVAFVDEVLVQKDGNKITKEIMYRVYSKWCQEKKVPRATKVQLGRNLAKYTNYMIAKGGKDRIWENVGFSVKYDDFDTFSKTYRDNIKV